MFGIKKIVNTIFSDDNNHENKKDELKNLMVNALNLLLGIFIILVILLAGTMLGVKFEHGILDINVMISVMPTLIGGYLGFLGSIIGVIGAYLILKKQLSDEDKKLKEKEQLEIKMMKCLLEYTVSETDYIVQSICDSCSNMYSEYLGREVLEYKFDDSNNHVSPIIGHLLSKNPKKDDLNILEDLGEDKAFIEKVKNKYNKYNPYKQTFKNIYNRFNDINDYRLLVYDKKWDSYLISIKNSGKFDYEDIEKIINWIGILNNNIVRNNIEKLGEMEEEQLLRDSKTIMNTSSVGSSNSFINSMILNPSSKQLNKKRMKLEIEILNHIQQFIDCRDDIITLVENKDKFGEEVLSWEFEYSHDIMIESIILTESIHNIVK
ncbi:hypothetical protein [Intestinibacter bartlettii]|uniref:hypothetical protein n=1 Tax=Intestinibacter bartlettii TaxID=261299 RepID=UPI0039936617